MVLWGADTYPSRNRLRYTYLLVIWTWFHPYQVYSMFDFTFLWDKKCSMATSLILFRWFVQLVVSIDDFTREIVDQILVHPGVAPSSCFLFFGCLFFMLSIYSFIHDYMSICLHYILLHSILVIWYAGFWFSMLGGCYYWGKRSNTQAIMHYLGNLGIK